MAFPVFQIIVKNGPSDPSNPKPDFSRFADKSLGKRIVSYQITDVPGFWPPAPIESQRGLVRRTAGYAQEQTLVFHAATGRLARIHPGSYGRTWKEVGLFIFCFCSCRGRGRQVSFFIKTGKRHKPRRIKMEMAISPVRIFSQYIS